MNKTYNTLLYQFLYLHLVGLYYFLEMTTAHPINLNNIASKETST